MGKYPEMIRGDLVLADLVSVDYFKYAHFNPWKNDGREFRE
jgi:hypothetical protein